MIRYDIQALQTQAHTFEVKITVPNPAPEQLVSLPVWIPGSYLVREFARHLNGLTATQGKKACDVQQLDKARWLVHAEGKGELVLSYTVYAFDTSVRCAFLDADRGFFNGTGVFLRVEGREAEPHEMRVKAPKGWQVATGLEAVEVDAHGQGAYMAHDYDDLVDQPVELGQFWRGRFEACGVPHEFVVAGALPGFDGERLIEDTRRICEAQIRFWHGENKPPFKRYVFMLNAVDEGYGGLEHKASTALIANRRDLPTAQTPKAPDEGYTKLLGLISHEYFHTWNVKRLRPAELARYDYTQENYTELLWFFEGFTSYYDDLFLLRAGLIDEVAYLKLLAGTVNNVIFNPGRFVQSLAESSRDTWIRYYRQDENTPNSTISYYTKGALVGLGLDISLRTGEVPANLDEMMRALWVISAGGPISEGDVAEVLHTLSERSYLQELSAWVHGTQDLPLRELLARVGVDWKQAPAKVAARLGLRAADAAHGVQVKSVLSGSVAEAAGVNPGDEILAVDGWRLRKLDALPTFVPADAKHAKLLVSRDGRVRELKLELPKTSDGEVSLSLAADVATGVAVLRDAWFKGAPALATRASAKKDGKKDAKKVAKKDAKKAGKAAKKAAELVVKADKPAKAEPAVKLDKPGKAAKPVKAVKKVQKKAAEALAQQVVQLIDEVQAAQQAQAPAKTAKAPKAAKAVKAPQAAAAAAVAQPVKAAKPAKTAKPVKTAQVAKPAAKPAAKAAKAAKAADVAKAVAAVKADKPAQATAAEPAVTPAASAVQAGKA